MTIIVRVAVKKVKVRNFFYARGFGFGYFMLFSLDFVFVADSRASRINRTSS